MNIGLVGINPFSGNLGVAALGYTNLHQLEQNMLLESRYKHWRLYENSSCWN